MAIDVEAELAWLEAEREDVVCPVCGGELALDPLLEAESIGGLVLIGWQVCQTFGCGGIWLSRGAVARARAGFTGGRGT